MLDGTATGWLYTFRLLYWNIQKAQKGFGKANILSSHQYEISGTKNGAFLTYTNIQEITI